MKKMLVLVFAFGMAMAGFAQTPGLTFGTWSFAGAEINSPNLFSIYSETYIAYKGKDMGVSSTLINELYWKGVDKKTVPEPSYYFSIQDLMVWYKPYPFLKAFAGKLFETGDAVLSSYIDYRKFSSYLTGTSAQEPGIMASAYPTRELTVSAFVPFTQLYSYDLPINAAFSARYTVPKLANFVAMLRLRNFEISAGVDLRIISDLILKAGLKVELASTTAASLFFTAGKKFGTLNLGVDGDLKILPGDFGAGLKVMAEYGIGNYIAGISLAGFRDDLWYMKDGTWTSIFGSSVSTGVVPYIYARRDFQNGSVTAGIRFQSNFKIVEWSIPIRFVFFF